MSVVALAGEEEEEGRSGGNAVVVSVDGLPWSTSYLIKMLYFLEALGSSTWGRFGVLYYNEHGLNSEEIGYMEGIMTGIVRTTFMPIWGYISDRYCCRKEIYLVTKFVGTCVLMLLALPCIYNSHLRIFIVSIAMKAFVTSGILDSYTLELLGMRNKTLYGRYRLFASISWGLGSILMGYITDTIAHGSFEYNFIFYAVLGYAGVILIWWRIPSSRPNTTTLTTLATQQQDHAPGEAERQSTHNDFQNVDNHDVDDNINVSENPETIVSTDSAMTMASTSTTQTTTTMTATIQHQQPPDTGGVDTDVDVDVDGGRLMDVIMLACRPRVFVFLVEVIMMGTAMATVERLLFLYLINDLQASNLLCGFTVGINVIFEIPIFWYTDYYMKLLRGHDGMMIMAMICYVVRVYGYTFLQPSTCWYVLFLETLHGITFACYWAVSTDIAKTLVHEIPNHHGSDNHNNYNRNGYWATTIPSTISMLYSSVGVCIGSVGGGYYMHHYGSKYMYRFIATVVFITLSIHIIGTFISQRCYKQGFLPQQQQQPQQPDDERNTNDQQQQRQSQARGERTASSSTETLQEPLLSFRNESNNKQKNPPPAACFRLFDDEQGQGEGDGHGGQG